MYVHDGLAQFQVFWAKHDVLVTSHFGFNKTMELVSWYYWWPQLWKYVKEFVGSCVVCVWAKNPRRHPHELLQPLPILWFHIGGGGLLDKYGSFHSMQQINNWWKDSQVISWSCVLISWSSWRYHFWSWTSIFGIQVLEEVFWAIKHENEIVIGLPPPNRWANKTG